MKIDQNPPAIIREVVDLHALAAEINAAHQAGEEAARRGLEQFRRAGEALLKAKKQCGHGNWTKWLQQNVHCSARTATRYMQFARSDGSEEAWAATRPVQEQPKSETVSDLPTDGKPSRTDPRLSVIRQHFKGETEADDAEDAKITDTPPAIALLAEAGFLDRESVTLLLGIRNDYGDEVVERIPKNWNPAWVDARPGNTWITLDALRPLDYPPLRHSTWEDDSPAGKAITSALKNWLQQVGMRDYGTPAWERTANWLACRVAALKLTAGQVALIDRIWREGFRSALAWFVTDGFKGDEAKMNAAYEAEEETLRQTYGQWRDYRLGYKSDLLHTGVLAAAELMRTEAREAWPNVDTSTFPRLWDSFDAGIELAISDRGYAYPSNMQLRLRECQNDGDKEPESAPTTSKVLSSDQCGPYGGDRY
jgi:hypothetical protein